MAPRRIRPFETFLTVCVTVASLCVSVPIIATAVQEELETGSASSGDASGATNTVMHSITCCIMGNLF